MRNLPDKHLALSVLISLGNSSGSGFLYRTETSVYLVTAKHVLFNEEMNLRTNEIEIVCQSSNLFGGTTNRLRIDFLKITPQYHKKTDIAIVKIGNVGGKPKDLKIKYPLGIEHLEKGDTSLIAATFDNINNLKDVMISNDVYVFGYPTSLGIETSKQFDQNKPLLRKGIVANIHEIAQTIILDCAVYGGNSGGPVIQVIEVNGKRELKLIGVISQYIPFVQRWKNERDRIIHLEHLNSGYSVATSFDSVLELINSEQTPTANSG